MGYFFVLLVKMEGFIYFFKCYRLFLMLLIKCVCKIFKGKYLVNYFNSNC